MDQTTTPGTRDHRAPWPLRLAIGMLAGVMGGTVFYALNSWFALSTGKDELAPFRTMATLVQGPPPEAAEVWIGVVVHVVLSVAFGALFTVLARPSMSGAIVAWSGLFYGGLLYLVNFQLLSRYVDYWSAFLHSTNQPFELAAHLVFGAVLAFFLIPVSRDAMQARSFTSNR